MMVEVERIEEESADRASRIGAQKKARKPGKKKKRETFVET
jgi:hypothetical protein